MCVEPNKSPLHTPTPTHTHTAGREALAWLASPVLYAFFLPSPVHCLWTAVIWWTTPTPLAPFYGKHKERGARQLWHKWLGSCGVAGIGSRLCQVCEIMKTGPCQAFSTASTDNLIIQPRLFAFLSFSFHFLFGDSGKTEILLLFLSDGPFFIWKSLLITKGHLALTVLFLARHWKW